LSTATRIQELTSLSATLAGCASLDPSTSEASANMTIAAAENLGAELRSSEHGHERSVAVMGKHDTTASHTS
jgi:hypothetical protein